MPVNANGNGSAATSAPVFPQLSAGEFSPLAPARILDTRNATGTCFSATGSSQACATIGAGATEQLQVTGAGGVPASGASAVAMNVTVTAPTAASVLTVWPSDAAQPGVSTTRPPRRCPAWWWSSSAPTGGSRSTTPSARWT